MKNINNSHRELDRREEQLPTWMQHTLRCVQQMDYGQITLTIHQGKVVEIQRTERTRIQSSPGSALHVQ